MKEGADGGDSITAAAAAGASFLMVAAAAQRGFTFLLNFALLRYVSSDVIGFASSDMELLLSLVLFTSREAVRIVSLRSAVAPLSSRPSATATEPTAPADAVPSEADAADRRRRQQAVNLAWLPVVIGAVLCAVAIGYKAVAMPPSSAAWRRGLDEETVAFMMYVLAAGVELLAEPLYIMSASSLLFGTRAAAETAGSVARCITTFLAVAWGGYTWAGFAAGQVVFALVMAGVYLRAVGGVASRHGVPWPSLLPSALPPANHETWWQAQLGTTAVGLLPTMVMQTVVKHALTEGDRIIMTTLLSRAQRGVYAVVVNYGSLPARFLFQPLEESLRSAVSRLLSSAPDTVRVGDATPAMTQPTTTTTGAKRRGRRGSGTSDTTHGGQGDGGGGAQVATAPTPPIVNASRRQAMQSAVTAFVATTYVLSTVGAFAACIGAPLARQGAILILGGAWASTEAPAVLAVYCMYLWLCALNGPVEAVAVAFADDTRLSAVNRQYLAFFFVYAGVATVGAPWLGVVAFVLANGVNMALRVATNMDYIQRTCTQWQVSLSWHQLLPSPSCLALWFGVGMASTWLVGMAPATLAASTLTLAQRLRVAGPFLTVALSSVVAGLSGLWLLEAGRLRQAWRTARGRAVA